LTKFLSHKYIYTNQEVIEYIKTIFLA